MLVITFRHSGFIDSLGGTTPVSGLSVGAGEDRNEECRIVQCYSSKRNSIVNRSSHSGSVAFLAT